MSASILALNELIHTCFFDLPLTLHLHNKGWMRSKAVLLMHSVSLMIALFILISSYLLASCQAQNFFFLYLFGLILFALPSVFGLFELDTNFKDYLTLNEPYISPKGYQYILKTFCVQYEAVHTKAEVHNKPVHPDSVQLRVGKIVLSMG
ncbi:hypothetical protein [Vampirovibrio sp.]|uniref:hypothetical protein n=1 Tax=Vampirovibrio sp. TaxID=2717857 RepID=UPI003594243C